MELQWRGRDRDHPAAHCDRGRGGRSLRAGGGETLDKWSVRDGEAYGEEAYGGG